MSRRRVFPAIPLIHKHVHKYWLGSEVDVKGNECERNSKRTYLDFFFCCFLVFPFIHLLSMERENITTSKSKYM